MKLSVVITVFNKGKYLKKCIESVLHQTYKELEIVLIDDGSTDNSGKICDDYASKYKNIYVVHDQNRGMIAARFKGVTIARGDYITFVDADDWISFNMYSLMLSKNKNEDMIACQINRYFNEDVILPDQCVLQAGMYDKSKIIAEIFPVMLWHPMINSWAVDPSLCSKIFRKNLLLNCMENALSLHCSYGEDTAILYPYLLQIENVNIMSDCLYYHRQRDYGCVPYYIEDDKFIENTYTLYLYLKKIFSKSQYWNILKGQLEHFMVKSISLKKMCFDEKQGEFFGVFPFTRVKRDSNVVLYGAGKLGREYVRQNEIWHFVNIVLWVDRNSQIIVPQYEISSVGLIENVKYDYIIIAVDIRASAYKIKQDLVHSGINENKIVWHSIRCDSFS